MDGMLSQDEINALLNGMNSDDSSDDNADSAAQDSSMAGDNNTNNDIPDTDEVLSDYEKDAVGEISNISMGTAATTLSSLLNQKVNITTPRVEIADWEHLSSKYDRPCVMLQIRYKEGLDGNNVLILKEKDVKRQTLLELVDYMTSVPTKFNEVTMQEIIKMVSSNLFRSLPSCMNDNKLPDVFDPEDVFFMNKSTEC